MDMDMERSSTTINTSAVGASRPVAGNNMMMKWLRIAIYTLLVIGGSAGSSLLSRLYYDKGGSSKWLGTLLQTVGFPLLFPMYFFLSKPKLSTTPNTTPVHPKPRSISSYSSLLMLLLVYVILGLFVAGVAYLMSVGYQYLPASIVILISASQLAFNALFSYLLNKQNFTPFIVNSLVIVTVSSALMVANSSTEKPPGVSHRQFATGFICTFIAAALNGLNLASQQLVFRKLIKAPTMKSVLDVIIYPSLVASLFILIGFFASGEWKGLHEEMVGYKLGKVSYVMTVVWTAVAYQVSSFGGVALVFEVSALFCNVIGALVLPIVPILSIFIFHDKIDGVKGVAMLLAVWGFLSYVYQNYLDDYTQQHHVRIHDDQAHQDDVEIAAAL